MMKLTYIAGLLAGLALAQGLIAAPAFAGQKLMVEKNHTLRVALNGSAGSVIVGNPDIADVTVVDSRTIYVVGKGFGSSAVSITDRMGHTLFDGEVIVTAANKGSINVYKGLVQSTVVCSDVCITDPATSSANTTPALTPVATAASSAIGAAQAAASMGSALIQGH